MSDARRLPGPADDRARVQVPQMIELVWRRVELTDNLSAFDARCGL